MLIATALTLALIGFVATTLADLARRDGLKIVAALRGHGSSAHTLIVERPVSVRFSPRYMAARPEARPALRAAA